MSEKRNVKRLEEALGYLEDTYIEEVARLRMSEPEGKKQSKKKKYVLLAASVCLCIMGTWIYGNHIRPVEEETQQKIWTKEEEGQTLKEDVLDKETYEEKSDGVVEAFTEESAEGVYLPPIEVNLKKDIAEDMVACFVYEGRCYVQYSDAKAENVGVCVGEVTGLLDEWTPEEGYVEGAGTFSGKIYEVTGISPEFMLCTIWTDGRVETFIHNNGITLETGADLLDERLHIRGQVTEVSFESDSVYDEEYTMESRKKLEENAIWNRLLDFFAEHNFVWLDSQCDTAKEGTWEESEMYHLYYTREDGLTDHFILEDGYMRFAAFSGIGIPLEPKLYGEVLEVLENQ